MQQEARKDWLRSLKAGDRVLLCRCASAGDPVYRTLVTVGENLDGRVIIDDPDLDVYIFDDTGYNKSLGTLDPLDDEAVESIELIRVLNLFTSYLSKRYDSSTVAFLEIMSEQSSTVVKRIAELLNMPIEEEGS